MRYLILVFVLACETTAAVADVMDSIWFEPVLAENNDPACEGLLMDARKKFLTDSSFDKAYGVRGQGYSQNGNILDWKLIGGVSSSEVTAFGRTYYLDYYTHPGCGGACERNQPLVSDKPFPKPRDYGYLHTLAENAPPAVSYNYTIARASEDGVYLFAVGSTAGFEDKILIYRLAREGRWAPACTISTAPANLSQKASEKLISSLESLRQVVDSGLMRGAGSCGSMHTHWRWKGYVRHALQTVLYRPWVLRESNSGADVDGSYNNDMKYLEQWSLLGLSEYSAFQQFQEQLREATEQLTAFFQEVNGWPLDTARTMASDALKGAVSTGIRFYMYDPQFAQGEEAVRRAILEKQDIQTVRSLSFDSENIDALAGSWGYPPESNETVLSVAVEYPKALGFLLDKGVHPDHANEFGKTPLMYAAQYNQVDSAKLLLEHGADVNAVTTKPLDGCYYTLTTYNMTALHYAVRYASPKMIRFLLDSGAEPLIKVENQNQYPKARKTPLDWLRLYTGVDAEERNPNVPEARVAEIEQWLTPLTPEQAIGKAADYVVKAEADYQKGNLVQAYRQASLARQLQPKNQRALADLSLIALKNGKYGESLEASRQLILSDASMKIHANAWFNQGLACEQYKAQTNRESLNFNGESYCTYGVLYPYLKSYQTEPTSARANKLKALFDDHAVPYCEVHTDTGILKINFQMGSDPEKRGYRQLQTLYVLHSPEQRVTGEDLAWEAGFYKAGVRQIVPIVPAKAASLTLDDKTMSVFNTTMAYVQFPYQVFGESCTQKESLESPSR